MKTFRSDDIDDGLYTLFPTILIRVDYNLVSVGFWWWKWCVRSKWRRWNGKVL